MVYYYSALSRGIVYYYVRKERIQYNRFLNLPHTTVISCAEDLCVASTVNLLWALIDELKFQQMTVSSARVILASVQAIILALPGQ